MRISLIILVSLLVSQYGHSITYEKGNAKNSIQKTDKRIGSSFVYWLPFSAGKKYFLIQGPHGIFSHRGTIAYDFPMKKRTPIRAIRGGKVISTKADSRVRGLKASYITKGNYIIIEHEDGSQAYYWHLDYNGVQVAIGDNVEQGQVIGLSGNTGYSSMPHLHLQLFDHEGKGIRPRFITTKGIKYLKSGRWYCAKY